MNNFLERSYFYIPYGVANGCLNNIQCLERLYIFICWFVINHRNDINAVNIIYIKVNFSNIIIYLFMLIVYIPYFKYFIDDMNS